MGKHAAPKVKYTWDEWIIGISGLIALISLPLLLVTIIVAQITILNTTP